MVSETQGVLKTRAFELACCYIPRAAVTKTRRRSCAALDGRIVRARGPSYNRAFGEDCYLIGAETIFQRGRG